MDYTENTGNRPNGQSRIANPDNKNKDVVAKR